jgi:hypothetical protein
MYTFSNYTKQLKSRSSVHMSSPLGHEVTHRCSPRTSRRSRPGVSEEEEAPPSTPHSSHRMKEEEWCGGGWSFPPPSDMREEEQSGSWEK